MKHSLTILFLLFICLANAQTAGEQARDAEYQYENGNYHAAVISAVKALRIKSTNRKAQDVIQTSYDALENLVIRENRKLDFNIEDLEGEEATKNRSLKVEQLTILIDARDEAISLPKITRKSTKQPLDFGSNDFYDELKAARNELKETKATAAEFHYQEGLKLMNKSDSKETQKEAAKQFRKSFESVKNYKDSQSLYNQCKEKAIVRIAIVPFENLSSQPKYGAIENVVSDKMVAKLMDDDEAMEFTVIVTREELNLILNEQKLSMEAFFNENTAAQTGAVLGVDLLIIGSINQINYQAYNPNTRSYNESQRIVVRYVKKVNSKGRTYNDPVWGDVSARVTEHTKEAKSQMTGSFRLINVSTGEIEDSGSFDEKFTWTHSWGAYSGDERALSDPSRHLCSKKAENHPPATELLNSLAGTLARKITSQLILALT